MSDFWRISFFYGFLAQNRPKWPIPPKRNFSLGWSKWESYSPGCTGDMSCWQKSRFPNKKWLLAQIPIFFGMDCTFLSQAANWSLNNQHFQHERGVPDMRVPRVLLPPPKKRIFGPKTAKFGPKLVYLAKYFFWPKWSHARKKTMPRRWFSVMWVPHK